MIKTLAIETSCDDTSVWIVSFDWEKFSTDALLAYSQIDDHQKYWGVVPEIASRLHSDKIIEVIKNIWLEKIKEVDFISVTVHPWLPGSLVVGKSVASLLSNYFAKPLIQVNHIYWHLFSILLERKLSDLQFPLVVLTASGGHNDIYIVQSVECRVQSKNQPWTLNSELIPQWNEIERREFGGYKIARVGYTLDDAAGECFDKVARMLWGPYPWWQRIGEKALKSSKYQDISSKTNNELCDPDFSEEQITNNVTPTSRGNKLQRDDKEGILHTEDIKFKRIFLSKQGFEFSFSWMKSQVSFLLKQLTENWKLNIEHWKLEIPEGLICDIAYEFQEAVVEVMVKKLIRAGISFDAKTVAIAWGVSCNDRLREYLNNELQITNYKLQIKETKQNILESEKSAPMVCLKPVKKVYSTDNAAMIGLAGILEYTNT